MSPAVRHIIDNEKFYLGSVQRVAENLPPSDAELSAWITAVVDSHDSTAFHFLLCAAALVERPVASHHLRLGLSMMSNVEMTFCLVWQMQGDLPADLLHATRHSVMSHPMHAVALLVIHAWCAQHRHGVFPPEIVTEARLLAHAAKKVPDQLYFLWGLAQRINDPHLDAVLVECFRGKDIPRIKQAAIIATAGVFNFIGAPISYFLAKEADHRISAAGTLRRAVERIGRNDPCPCGSGKKYKRCCEAKDQERLRHSSTVAGMTQAEVRARPEEQLTRARLEKMTGHELARLDPLLVKPALRETYIIRLGAGGFLSEICTIFETLGCGEPHLLKLWHEAFLCITLRQRLDCARRMMQVRYQHGPAWGHISPGISLLLCSDDLPRYYDMLEHLCHETVRSNDDVFHEKLAFGLLCSPLKSLGILVARSSIPISSKPSATFMIEQIQAARDRLHLPPEEPFADVLEQRLNDTTHETGAEAAALQQSRHLLAEKAAEIRTRNEKLAQLQRDIRLHEKQRVTAAALPPRVSAEEDTLRLLREKLAATSASLSAANAERTALRRQAMEAVRQVEAERAKHAAAQPRPTDDSDADDDATLTLPGGIDSQQLPRPIDFPRRFHDTLSQLPTQTGRAALILIGRIAAGDPSAFAGVVRLRVAPDVLRIRIGRDHRLLFRLHPDRVELVDLINRRDLDRRIGRL